MDQLKDEISAVLWTPGKPELITVCRHLKCSEPAGEGFKTQSHRTLIWLAESTLDEIEGSDESPVFDQFVSDFQLFIQSLPEQGSDKAEIQQTESEIKRLEEEHA